MSPLVILPDVERAIAFVLRAHPELADLLDRIFTVTPANVGPEPFVLVRRIGGAPTVSRPLVHEVASLQVDSYGGAKAVAQRWSRTVAAVLAELTGTVDDGMTVGVVTGTQLGPSRYLPDEVFEPARARYVLDVDVFVKRARPGVVPGGSNPAAVTAGAGS